MGLKNAIGGAYSKLIAGPMRSAVVGVAYHLVGKHVAAIERGEHGPAAQKLYLALKGCKRTTGALLFLGSGVLTAIGHLAAAANMALVAGFLLAAGLIDAEWWKDAPETIHGWRMYVWAQRNAQAIFGFLEAGGLWVHTCNPTTAAMLAVVHVQAWSWTLSCEQAGVALMVGGAVMSVAGLSAESRLAQPPLSAVLASPIPGITVHE